MKKRVIKLAAAILCPALLCSLCGCGMLKQIRENAQRMSELEIVASPADDALVKEFNAALAKSGAELENVGEMVSYSVGRPRAEGEGKGVDILNAAADTLKKMIMEKNPGSSGDRISFGEGLLLPLPENVPAAAASRNSTTVNVTDEAGEDVKDEDGNVVTAQKISDNLLTTVFRFYTEETKTETAEDGTVKEETVLVPAGDALIEQVFGPLKEKEDVLAAFDAVKGYLEVKDYTVTYKNCTVTAAEDLDTGLLQSADYVKTMAVTANVTGAGPLSEMGDLTVTFDVTKTVHYNLFSSEDAGE